MTDSIRYNPRNPQGERTSVYLPLDIEFTISFGRNKGHPLVRAMIKGRQSGIPGSGSARRAYAQARARARVRAGAGSRAGMGTG